MVDVKSFGIKVLLLFLLYQKIILYFNWKIFANLLHHALFSLLVLYSLY